MFNKISTTFVLFLILGLVSPIFASSPCNCETLPSHVGTIIGDLEHLVDEVVSDVIEPVGSAVTSLVDDLLSNLLDLDINNILGCDSNLIDLDGVLGNSGIVGGLLGCDDLTCVFVDLDFCGNNNDLAIVVEPFTDYYIGVFGADCNFLIDYDLSCHGSCH